MVRPPTEMGAHSAFYAEPVDGHAHDAAFDLGSWVEYLVHPEKHDGPRALVCDACGDRREIHERPKPPLPDHVCPAQGGLTVPGDQLVTRSVIEDADPAHFFQAMHALCGIVHAAPNGIGGAFEKLALPYLLDGTTNRADRPEYVQREPYGDEKLLRDQFQDMRASFVDVRTNEASAFEQVAIEFAVGHENSMYVIAEMLAKYRAIHLEARNEVRELMDKLTEAFQKKVNEPFATGSISIPFFKIVLAGVTSLAISVGTGGAGAAPAISTALSALSAAIGGTSATAHVAGASYQDLSDDFFAEVDRIGNEVYEEVKKLAPELTTQLATIRDRHPSRVRPPDAPTLQFPPR